MEASRELFAAKGFHSAPMAELAAAAQVSVGQIYRHFPCKDDIIVGIAEEDAHENRSEEHTSELQSLMRISYAVFCLKKKTPSTPESTPIRPSRKRQCQIRHSKNSKIQQS